MVLVDFCLSHYFDGRLFGQDFFSGETIFPFIWHPSWPLRCSPYRTWSSAWPAWWSTSTWGWWFFLSGKHNSQIKYLWTIFRKQLRDRLLASNEIKLWINIHLKENRTYFWNETQSNKAMKKLWINIYLEEFLLTKNVTEHLFLFPILNTRTLLGGSVSIGKI